MSQLKYLVDEIKEAKNVEQKPSPQAIELLQFLREQKTLERKLNKELSEQAQRRARACRRFYANYYNEQRQNERDEQNRVFIASLKHRQIAEKHRQRVLTSHQVESERLSILMKARVESAVSVRGEMLRQEMEAHGQRYVEEKERHRRANVTLRGIELGEFQSVHKERLQIVEKKWDSIARTEAEVEQEAEAAAIQRAEWVQQHAKERERVRREERAVVARALRVAKEVKHARQLEHEQKQFFATEPPSRRRIQLEERTGRWELVKQMHDEITDIKQNASNEPARQKVEQRKQEVEEKERSAMVVRNEAGSSIRRADQEGRKAVQLAQQEQVHSRAQRQRLERLTTVLSACKFANTEAEQRRVQTLELRKGEFDSDSNKDKVFKISQRAIEAEQNLPTSLQSTIVDIIRDRNVDF